MPALRVEVPELGCPARGGLLARSQGQSQSEMVWTPCRTRTRGSRGEGGRWCPLHLQAGPELDRRVGRSSCVQASRRVGTRTQRAHLAAVLSYVTAPTSTPAAPTALLTTPTASLVATVSLHRGAAAQRRSAQRGLTRKGPEHRRARGASTARLSGQRAVSQISSVGRNHERLDSAQASSVCFGWDRVHCEMESLSGFFSGISPATGQAVAGRGAMFSKL